MTPAVSINPEVLGGKPCFSGTRVPVNALFDLLKRGYSLDEFLADFPTVKRWQVEQVLDAAGRESERQAERAGAA
jgi:uncharacterized protein (DUF433 family)